MDAPRPGISVKDSHPKVHRALLQVASAARAAARESGVDRRLVELVNVRCSQLNGCAACLDTHTAVALARGETPQRLGVLAAWREAGLFTDVEGAALELAETYTTLRHHDLARAEARARAHLTEDQLAAVLAVVVAIDAFNRVTVAAHREIAPR